MLLDIVAVPSRENIKRDVNRLCENVEIQLCREYRGTEFNMYHKDVRAVKHAETRDYAA